MNKRALLLSGGAFRGAVQVPVIERLFKEYQYDAVYGVSVGAINGSMFAQHELDGLRELWDGVDGIKDFLMPKWYWPFKGFYSMKPLREKIENNLSLEKMKIPFTSGVVSGTTGEYFNLSTEEMKSDLELWDAVQSSSCMAGIMIPGTFEYNNKKHLGFDGGFRNIIPIPPVDYKIVDVVSCTPLDRMKMKIEFNKKGIINIILRGIDIFEDEIFDKDISELKCSKIKEVNLYAPSKHPGAPFAADKETIQYRYELGEEAYQNPIKLK